MRCLLCSLLLLALPAAHALRSVRPLWDRAHARFSKSLPAECRASFALSGFERGREVADDRAPQTLTRVAARAGGAGTSIVVSGWLPGEATMAENPPALLVNAEPHTASVLVLAFVLLMALPMARGQPSDPIQ